MLNWLRRLWTWYDPRSAPKREVILLPAATTDSNSQPKPEPVILEPAVAEPEPAEAVAPPIQAEPVILAAEPVILAAEPLPIIVESEPDLPPIDWRGPAYFTPGGYARRWGIESVLRPRIAFALPAPTYRRPAASSPSPPSSPAKSAFEVSEPARKAFSFLPVIASSSGTRVDPATFTEFLLTREEELSPAAARYWTGSAVLRAARRLLDKLLTSREDAPLTAAEFLDESEQSDPALGLLVCHNVARAFARGSTALNLKRTVERSSFYRFFDSRSLGALDPGAWYRHFGLAAAAAFAARGSLESSSDPIAPCAASVDQIAQLLLTTSEDPRYVALAWVNAIQFWEWGIYSRSLESIKRSAGLGLEAFEHGLKAASLDTSGPWRWRLPNPAGANEEELQADLPKAQRKVEEAAALLRPMSVKTNLLTRILGLSSPQIQRQRNTARFTLVLTVEDSIACRFAAGSWNDPRLDNIANDLVSQIGWKRVEHSPARQVIVRCIAPSAGSEPVRCQMDFGSGFETLPVCSEGEA